MLLKIFTAQTTGELFKTQRYKLLFETLYTYLCLEMYIQKLVTHASKNY